MYARRGQRIGRLTMEECVVEAVKRMVRRYIKSVGYIKKKKRDGDGEMSVENRKIISH